MRRGPHCVDSDFCEEIAGAPDTTFSAVYEGDPASRVIGETPRFRLIADMSPLCVGHLLFSPLEHYLSFAEFVDAFHAEFATAFAAIGSLYRAAFGRLTVLEHGSSDAMRARACISHAHWHILPVQGARVDSLISADGLSSRCLADFSELAAFKGEPYFLCAHEDEWRVYDGSTPMRSQYLRSVIGRLLGIPDPLWDYALVVRKELLRETMALTSGWHDTLQGIGASS
ncbi:HIT domain-containing protein [Streptomyces sp. NPDC046985]|uniref:HIT family protein n=1 Tax=Streptomyces sp. NPDC046985 TaxID=3155377 RepID=UPI0033CA8E9B